MKELNIQNPCDNCELRNKLETDQGQKELALEGLCIAVYERDGLLGCRHPWRLLYEVYERNPSDVQTQILGKIVEVRGKIPEEYGLPVVDKISTLDL